MNDEKDDLPFPIVASADSGVRIALNTKLLLEHIAQNRAHRLDNDLMLRAMQGSLKLLFIRARRGDKKSSERLFEIHKLLYPEAHELSVPVERALDFRYLMCELSYLVTPASPDNQT